MHYKNKIQTYLLPKAVGSYSNHYAVKCWYSRIHLGLVANSYTPLGIRM